jgi:hypothetical protein
VVKQTRRTIRALKKIRQQKPAETGLEPKKRASFSPTKTKLTPMPRWSVDIIRKRGEHIGVVSAPNEKEALAKAIKQFEIEPARRNRIMVTKISNRDDDA